jgi:hypothetical protein
MLLLLLLAVLLLLLLLLVVPSECAADCIADVVRSSVSTFPCTASANRCRVVAVVQVEGSPIPSCCHRAYMMSNRLVDAPSCSVAPGDAAAAAAGLLLMLLLLLPSMAWSNSTGSRRSEHVCVAMLMQR